MLKRVFWNTALDLLPDSLPGCQLLHLHPLPAHSLRRVEDLDVNDFNPCRGITCRWTSIPEGLGRTFAKTGGKLSSNSMVRMARCRGASVQSHHPAWTSNVFVSGVVGLSVSRREFSPSGTGKRKKTHGFKGNSRTSRKVVFEPTRVCMAEAGTGIPLMVARH